MNVRPKIRLGTLIGMVVIFGGCGGGDVSKPPLGQVSGKVSYKGTPVSKGIVTFVPVGGPGAKTGQPAAGDIGSDGSYTLTTFEDGDGAVLGQHVVLVQSREGRMETGGHGMPTPGALKKMKRPESLLPEKYASSEKSPLRCEVKSGSIRFDIELTD